MRRRAALPSVSEALSYVIARRQNPHLTIQASGDPLAAGEQVVISGTVVAGARQGVTLLKRATGARFAPIAHTVTDADGHYFFAQALSESVDYRVTSARRSSAVLAEAVRPKLIAQASAMTLSAGQPLTISGSLMSARPGRTVYLQRQNASGIGFHVVGTGIVASDSTFSVSHSFAGGGRGRPHQGSR